MQKELKLAVIACCIASTAFAQTTDKQSPETVVTDESAFTFTESQLGEDDNVTQEVAVVGSNNNVYAREVGFRFSAARFKYRGFNSKYSDIYINGNPVNDAERGEFRYSFVGGLNNYTRGVESSLPFEDNNFAMPGMGGANNYNFRPSAQSAGHRLSISGANRNYTLRGMYSYNSGVNAKGWAFSAGITYRWASMGTAYVEGTFYNALSYFLGVEKVFNEKHSLSLVTWGNPTERAGQGASTDEMYWIANNRYYNPYWGYQNGKKRNSRIIKDFAPAAIMTWDWKMNQKTKLTTTLFGKYAMYSSSRLNYDNSDNPQPDYYKRMPSYFYDVWPPFDGDQDQTAKEKWQAAYDYLSASKANRQVNWEQLYYANKALTATDASRGAMYYLQAYHDDQLTLSLSSTMNKALTKKSSIDLGFNVSMNKGLHYQTMEDLLGAARFFNVNSYVIGTYTEDADEVQYDLNNPNREVKKGDRFGYDYNIYVNKGHVWATYAEDFGNIHYFLSGRLGGVTMQREGKMRNGLAKDNSYGKGRTAKFVEGGFKFGANVNLAAGNIFTFGIGYEQKAPNARTAFLAPQINNDFAENLKVEKIFSTEVGYQLQTTWLQANLSAYYSLLKDVSEYSMFYYDTEHSFSYVSLTGINKKYYGLELGLNFKVTPDFNIKALGTISEAKYTNNAHATYMLSEDGKYRRDIVVTTGIHEGCTPLTAASVDLSYHKKGWFIDLIGNYYDRIYLYYTPVTRYANDFTITGGEYGGRPVPQVEGGDGKQHDISSLPDQAQGHGGFMLDASIGKSIYLPKGRSMSINLMLTNILNNRNICTGGMEQNRRDVDEMGEAIRTYSFLNSPKKFYANGINGMLNITYKF